MIKKERIKFLLDFSIPLILGLITAILSKNIFPDFYQFILHHKWFDIFSLNYFINDIFMAFFFAIATVDIIQSTKPGGGLNPMRLAINPIVSSVGGVIFPILIYLLLNNFIGSEHYIHGFGIPIATDIALAWMFIRIIFGTHHPAVKFLLVLAIVDDIIGLLIIAFFYPDPTHGVQPQYLLFVAESIAFALYLRHNKVNNYYPYIFLCGLLSWLGLSLSHLHPALALCFIIPFIPSEKENKKNTHTKDKNDMSPLSMFEHRWRTIVDLGLFFFGFVNAGVSFSRFGTITVLVLTSLWVGKPLGIIIFSSICSFAGFKRPKEVDLSNLLIIGMVAGVGLTVSLFICELAFASQADIIDSAKMGALLSVFGGFFALLSGKRINKKNKPYKSSK